MEINIHVPSFRGLWKREAAPEMPRALASLARVRDFLYDSQVGEHEDFTRVLGVPPISDEVAEMERAASNLRVAKIVHLAPLLHAYAHTMAAAVTEHFRETAGSGDDADETWEIFHSTIEPIAHATIIGGLSQMVDIGLLQPKEPKA